jgi:energy-coupling factor transporter transmembrane protein EcfT
MKTLTVRVWLGVGVFTAMIAFPALFLTPGESLGRLPVLGWAFTQQGVRSAFYLLLRVEICTTFSLLLVLCTPWVHLLKALRVLRVPVVAVVILGMTHRFLFLLLQTAGEMWEARRVRRVGTLDAPLRRRMAMSAVGALMEKSLSQGQEVHQAMLARAFRGEVYTLDEFSLNTRDWIAGLGFFAVTLCVLFLGRL